MPGAVFKYKQTVVIPTTVILTIGGRKNLNDVD
jgi:hypothetical protein